jgi:hypothetical protein
LIALINRVRVTSKRKVAVWQGESGEVAGAGCVEGGKTAEVGVVEGMKREKKI